MIFYRHSGSRFHLLCGPVRVRSLMRGCEGGRKPEFGGVTTFPGPAFRFVQDLINWGAVDWDHSLGQWDLFSGCNYLHTFACANLPPRQVKTIPFVYSLLVSSFWCFLINFPFTVIAVVVIRPSPSFLFLLFKEKRRRWIFKLCREERRYE